MLYIAIGTSNYTANKAVVVTMHFFGATAEQAYDRAVVGMGRYNTAAGYTKPDIDVYAIEARHLERKVTFSAN